ncbi:MAG: hypothetical protein JJ979_03550, partial [Roseibium sp.]|nr:hypothetical protein [Roseibium sp.]
MINHDYTSVNRKKMVQLHKLVEIEPAYSGSIKRVKEPTKYGRVWEDVADHVSSRFSFSKSRIETPASSEILIKVATAQLIKGMPRKNFAFFEQEDGTYRYFVSASYVRTIEGKANQRGFWDSVFELGTIVFNEMKDLREQKATKEIADFPALPVNDLVKDPVGELLADFDAIEPAQFVINGAAQINGRASNYTTGKCIPIVQIDTSFGAVKTFVDGDSICIGQADLIALFHDSARLQGRLRKQIEDRSKDKDREKLFTNSNSRISGIEPGGNNSKFIDLTRSSCDQLAKLLSGEAGIGFKESQEEAHK